MIWNEKMECMKHEDLKNIQSERLRNPAASIHKNSLAYAAKLDAFGISPRDIKSIDDIKKLPFTVKDDLRDSYPFGLSRGRSRISMRSTCQATRPAIRPLSDTPKTRSKAGSGTLCALRSSSIRSWNCASREACPCSKARQSALLTRGPDYSGSMRGAF